MVVVVVVAVVYATSTATALAAGVAATAATREVEGARLDGRPTAGLAAASTFTAALDKVREVSRLRV